MNSGYVGMSMSVRATQAYEEGLKPISKWRKSDLLESIIETAEEESICLDLSKLKKCTMTTLKAYCLRCTEWHHTSGAFNETDFYSVDSDGIEELIDNNYKNIKKEEKKDDFEKGYVHGKYKETEYHAFSRHNKYSERWIPFVNGKVKGNWVYFEDGKKKKITNVKIEKRTKIRKRA